MDILNYLEKLKNILAGKKELYLRIKVNPGLSKSTITNIMDNETMKIDIAAPPEKGKANAELIKLIAKEFLVDIKSIKIISGVSSKTKLIKIKL